MEQVRQYRQIQGQLEKLTNVEQEGLAEHPLERIAERESREGESRTERRKRERAEAKAAKRAAKAYA